MLPDFYKILGISINATDEEIKMAFRLRAKRLHPDVNQSPDALAQFQLLAIAYETLTDPEKRKKYDLKFVFGIEMKSESAAPRHRDPKYHPGAVKAAYGKGFENHGKVERKRIIWLENILLGSLLIIGFSAFGFAVFDMMSDERGATEKGLTGILFSTVFLALLIYGWIFHIRKM